MSMPSSVQDREYKKFVEYPAGTRETAVKVKIGQEEGEAVKVDIGTRGVTKNLFNEVNSVPEEIETLINSFTVSVGKKLDLSNIYCSGDNIARFSVKINDDTIQVRRTWWSDFNANFDFLELVLSEGDKVEIFVENKGKGTSTFESTIVCGEYNAI